MLFTSPKEELNYHLKIKLNGKRLYEINSVKYLGIQIDKRLTWKQQINNVAPKINKGNAMLSKLSYALDIKALRSVYYAIFESHLCYASLVWAQNTNSVKRLHLLSKKSQSRNFHTGPLLKVAKILKSFLSKIAVEKCIFIRKSLKGLLPSIFNSWFKFYFQSHSHDTRWSNLGYLKIPSYCTKTHGRYSMFVNAIYVWNHFQSCHQNVIFHQLRANKERNINYFFSKIGITNRTSVCVYKLSTLHRINLL